MNQLQKSNDQQKDDAFNSVGPWNLVNWYGNDVFGRSPSAEETAENNLIDSYAKSVGAHRRLDVALESLFLVTRLEYQPTLSADTGDLYRKLDSTENDIQQAEKDFNKDVAKVQTAQRALEAELKNYNKAMNWTANQTQLTGGSFDYFESAVRNLNKKMQALKDAEKAVDNDYNKIIGLFKEKDDIYTQLTNENRQNKTQN